MLGCVSMTCALLGAQGAEGARERARTLRIVATIDGVDELHFGARQARWVHLEYSPASHVVIGGRAWDPSRDERLEAPRDEPFFDPELDLAGAGIRLLRGRGEIAFRHDPDGLVLRFDDSRGGGTGEYEVELDFADALCAAHTRLGDPPYGAMPWSPVLRIQAHVDGVDELHLGPERADWLHLAWSAPSAVHVGDLEWDALDASLRPPPGALFFPPGLDLGQVRLEVERARGRVSLAHSDERLFLRFDDGEPFGADDYAVRLVLPPLPADVLPALPTGPAVRVELRHAPPEDVAGAPLTVLARSPRSGELVPWPGLRGFDPRGRCVLALPAGDYRFEVLNRPGAERLVALQSGLVSVTRGQKVELAGSGHTLEWRQGKESVELRELALHSILPEGEVVWTRSEASAAPVVVVSAGAEFSLRAFGTRDEAWIAWWTRSRLGERAVLDSTAQEWARCSFSGPSGGSVPPGCTVRVHAPASTLEFPAGDRTVLLTNRRFAGLSYRLALPGGDEAVFHPRPVLLPHLGESERFELGGALTPLACVAVLVNEGLGSHEARQLWWELDLVDPAGSVLDTAASRIGWSAQAALRSGKPMPEAPLSAEGLATLADPVDSVVLEASYRWGGARSLRVQPGKAVVDENELYRSSMPGDLGARARAYLDKTRRTYRAIEAARGERGQHDHPIELKWWLNGGAVGAWGSITMPIAGLAEDYDWFSLPWALGHESLHAFGYPHGEELERLDNAVIHAFALARQAAERDPDFVPEGW